MKKPNERAVEAAGEQRRVLDQAVELERDDRFLREEHAVGDPRAEQLVGLGRGLDEGRSAERRAIASAMPPPVRIFMPCRSVKDLIGRLVLNIWPGPLGEDAEQMHAVVLARLVKKLPNGYGYRRPS